MNILLNVHSKYTNKKYLMYMSKIIIIYIYIHIDIHYVINFLSPQMNMLMRLKETAHCTGTESYDSDSTSNSVGDSSLESTL